MPVTNTKTETLPDEATTTKDKHVRHYVERTTPLGQVPPKYSRFALCGKRMTKLHMDAPEICQECVDELRRRGQG